MVEMTSPITKSTTTASSMNIASENRMPESEFLVRFNSLIKIKTKLFWLAKGKLRNVEDS